MYDTILFSGTRPLGWEIPPSLTQVKENIDKATGEIFLTGFVKSMFVRAKGSDILISGSIPRFLYGSNAFTITRSDTKQAIESLSDLVSLNLGRARAYRVDIGANLLLKSQVTDYMRFLGPWRQSHKREYSNGNISYQAGRNALIFYDKVLDLSRIGNEIPEHWEDKNVLRVEFQMKNNLKAQLGEPVFGETLYDEKFYFRAIKKWESAYLTVEKINQMEEIPMGSVRELKAYALNFWLHSVGYENLLHRMKLERGLGRITKSQEKELKRTFRQISNYKKGEARGLIEELDRKVKMVSANYR